MGRLVYVLLGILIGTAGSYWFLRESEPDLQEPEPILSQSLPFEPAPSIIVLSTFEELEAEVIAAIGRRDYVRAIELLMEADLIASATVEQDQVTRLLDEVVSLRVQQLNSRQQTAAIDALYERLSLAMPERAEFYILLAEHRIAMGNAEAALPVLAQIENHHQLGGLARQLIEQITNAQLPDDVLAQIPLEQSGNQFIVSVKVDEASTVDLLIDTGASMTTLSPELLSSLGYDLSGPRVNFSTASGVIQAPVVEVGSISLGPASVSQVAVGALAISRPSRQVDGLLGMNVLRHFEFTLDQEQRMLNLNSSRHTP